MKIENKKLKEEIGELKTRDKDLEGIIASLVKRRWKMNSDDIKRVSKLIDVSKGNNFCIECGIKVMRYSNNSLFCHFCRVNPKHLVVHEIIRALYTEIGHLKTREEKLKQKNKKLLEFVTDCSVSHIESRYKYRAINILRELKWN